ncbi:MAG: GDSL-type esterase/lipase family protein [Phormidesmis sp. CAN_BIN36]|nr:GDSL-type esterase/lipase family protein [Phormidesmis sp. CAN_BIN36]
MSVASSSKKAFPIWTFLTIAANTLLIAIVVLLVLRHERIAPIRSEVKIAPLPSASNQLTSTISQLEERHPLTYQQWVNLLGKEAKAIVKNKPDRLTILAGDSLSLWFPAELLPSDRIWLNQSISGETSIGLLKRLNLFDQTEPQAIFVMIGINDLAKGTSDQKLADSYKQIITTLKQVHPNAKIVVQSVLPRGVNLDASLEKRQQLLEISNKRIHTFNQSLETIAKNTEVSYLDLQSLVVDDEGYLRSEFTTDGLHLNRQGYLVWRSAIQIFSQLVLSQPAEKLQTLSN